MEQPRHVVIGRDQETRRIQESLVIEEQARIDVPMRTDQRQLPDGLVQATCYRPDARLRGKQPVRVQRQRVRAGHGCIIGDAAPAPQFR